LYDGVEKPANLPECWF